MGAALWRLLAAGLLAARSIAAAEIPAVAYHDIVPSANGDPYAITVEDFERQLEYLRKSGYQPISLRHLDAVRQGQATLPAKPVLLTFDDGYRSYYEHAFPRLERYGFPSVVSIVTAWVDGRAASDDTRAPIMNWHELREVARSPLVEVLSHTDDLHRSIPADRFDAYFPAAVTRRYETTSGRYETDAAHRRRIEADLALSAARIEAELGYRPIGIAWPYGDYEQALVEAAAALGMRYHLTLDSEPTQLASLPRINRETFYDYRGLADFGDILRFQYHRKHQFRVVEIDLAPLAALSEPARTEAIGALVRRVALLRVDAVVLRPFGAGGGQAYFQTDALPVAADVLSRVDHHLANRAGLLHLCLSVPASIEERALRELVRRHWFTAIALEGEVTPEVFRRVAGMVRRYKPAAKLGVRSAQVPENPGVDFLLVDLPAGDDARALVAQVDRVLSALPRSIFLVQRTEGTGDAALAEHMARLRAAGAPHYGYGLDDYLRGRPTPLAIVRSLTEHTVWR